MKLSSNQIQQLFTFTQQHYVEYYDLQTELVDHLANSIEEQWKENPKRSLEEALQMEFKKFGIFGFSDIVEQRQKAMNKKYNTLIWKHFKEFFILPRIIATVLVFVLIYKIASITKYQEVFIFGLISIFMLSVFINLIISHNKLKAKFVATQKKWLFEDVIYRCGSVMAFVQLPLQFLIRIGGMSESNKMTPLYLALFSLITGLLFIITYIIQFVIPSKASVYLRQTYPEYDLVL